MHFFVYISLLVVPCFSELTQIACQKCNDKTFFKNFNKVTRIEPISYGHSNNAGTKTCNVIQAIQCFSLTEDCDWNLLAVHPKGPDTILGSAKKSKLTHPGFTCTTKSIFEVDGQEVIDLYCQKKNCVKRPVPLKWKDVK